MKLGPLYIMPSKSKKSAIASLATKRVQPHHRQQSFPATMHRGPDFSVTTLWACQCHESPVEGILTWIRHLADKGFIKIPCRKCWCLYLLGPAFEDCSPSITIRSLVIHDRPALTALLRHQWDYA